MLKFSGFSPLQPVSPKIEILKNKQHNITLMKIFALTLITLGAYLAYSGYKKKFINTKEGQSVQDFGMEMLSSDPNAALQKGLGIGCAGYLKMMGMVLGIIFILIGLMILLL